MTQEAQAIEVEVLEVDGFPPVPVAERPADPDPWQQWQGRVRTLDARWWPLWILLGGIAVALLLTVGVVVAVAWMIYRIIRNAIVGFAELLSPNTNRSIR